MGRGVDFSPDLTHTTFVETKNHRMALYTMATDLNTKETIWVSTNIVKGRPQLNSHRSESYANAGIDGFPAWELAGLHTDYRCKG
jgi:hypothetical protein